MLRSAGGKERRMNALFAQADALRLPLADKSAAEVDLPLFRDG